MQLILIGLMPNELPKQTAWNQDPSKTPFLLLLLLLLSFHLIFHLQTDVAT